MLQDVHKDEKQRIHGGVSITAPQDMSTEANYDGPLSNVTIQEYLNILDIKKLL